MFFPLDVVETSSSRNKHRENQKKTPVLMDRIPEEELWKISQILKDKKQGIDGKEVA